ncbi:hypothetical protein HXX76_010576 [Chlamydomonas incerta]|uniref:Uncharacterized protein n=1 Tax=Chlamydomonas incerta TaxID=51695 RepID=A0A835VUH1_CHLIN|nr:hypothetical protein HXX76_010576 [Chlamydomonas incerta]|eukprot:KAG2429792.1 hypothetical protein HXX76_010576 [Chlamydomonas incerta]
MLEAGVDPRASGPHGTTAVQLLQDGRRLYSGEVAALEGSGRVRDTQGLHSMLRAIDDTLAACNSAQRPGGPAAGGVVGAGMAAGGLADGAAGLATPGGAAGKRRGRLQQASPVGAAAAGAALSVAGSSPAAAAAAPDAPRKRRRSDDEVVASTGGTGVKQDVRQALAVQLQGAAASVDGGPAAAAAAAKRMAVKPEPGVSAAVVGPCGSAARAAPAVAAAVKLEPCMSVMGSAARGGAAVKQEPPVQTEAAARGAAVKQEPHTPRAAASVCSGAARAAAPEGVGEHAPQPDQDPGPVMPFGQYAGRPLTQLPASYVCWMCQQEGMFSSAVQRHDLCQQLLDAGVIRPAAADTVSPVTEQPYLTGYEPVWRVAPATPEEQQEACEATMTFGQHKGERLSQVPSDYIGWMCRQPDFWDLSQLRKRELLRHLEVLGRVTYSRSGEVLQAASEAVAPRAVGYSWLRSLGFLAFGADDYDCDECGY